MNLKQSLFVFEVFVCHTAQLKPLKTTKTANIKVDTQNTIFSLILLQIFIFTCVLRRIKMFLRSINPKF